VTVNEVICFVLLAGALPLVGLMMWWFGAS